MSGRRGSNPRPTAWKAVALPTELLPLITKFASTICGQKLLYPTNKLKKWAEKDSNLRTRERTDLQSVAFSRSAIYPFYKLKNQKTILSI